MVDRYKVVVGNVTATAHGAEPSEFCHDCAHSLVDELRAERDQFKAMWERDSTALGKALAQRDTARTDAEDKRARVAEAVRMIEGYKRAGLLTNPATAEQAMDFISRATGNKPGTPK
jgi:hypothetical protein